MHLSFKVFALVAFGAITLSGAHFMADDEEKLAKAPVVVQATVKKTIGDGKLAGCDTVKKDGKTAYDVDFSIGGSDYAILVAENGDILQREVEIKMAMVPPAVLDASTKAHADGKVKEASIITAGEHMYYELEMMVGKAMHDVEISAGGKVLADTIAAPEADEAPAAAEKAGEKKD